MFDKNGNYASNANITIEELGEISTENGQVLNEWTIEGVGTDSKWIIEQWSDKEREQALHWLALNNYQDEFYSANLAATMAVLSVKSIRVRELFDKAS